MSIQDLSQQLKLLIMNILGRSLKNSKEVKKKTTSLMKDLLNWINI